DWFLGAYAAARLPALRRAVAGFHARRRRAGRGEVLEVATGAGDWSPPPPEALPRPWPVRLTLAPGDTTALTFLDPRPRSESPAPRSRLDSGPPPHSSDRST